MNALSLHSGWTATSLHRQVERHKKKQRMACRSAARALDTLGLSDSTMLLARRSHTGCNELCTAQRAAGGGGPRQIPHEILGVLGGRSHCRLTHGPVQLEKRGASRA